MKPLNGPDSEVLPGLNCGSVLTLNWNSRCFIPGKKLFLMIWEKMKKKQVFVSKGNNFLRKYEHEELACFHQNFQSVKPRLDPNVLFEKPSV